MTSGEAKVLSITGRSAVTLSANIQLVQVVATALLYITSPAISGLSPVPLLFFLLLPLVHPSRIPLGPRTCSNFRSTRSLSPIQRHLITRGARGLAA